MSPLLSTASAIAAQATSIQPRLGRARCRLPRQQIGEHGAGEEQAHAHVERVHARHHHEVRAREQRERAELAGGLAQEPPSGEPGDEHRGKPGEGGPEARRPLRDAERLVRRGSRPVLERRFLQVGEPVEPGRDPVAGDDHLARDLGVTTLVRMGEQPPGQLHEPERQQDQREADPEGAATRRWGGQDGVGGGGSDRGCGHAAVANARTAHSPRKRLARGSHGGRHGRRAVRFGRELRRRAGTRCSRCSPAGTDTDTARVRRRPAPGGPARRPAARRREARGSRRTARRTPAGNLACSGRASSRCRGTRRAENPTRRSPGHYFRQLSHPSGRYFAAKELLVRERVQVDPSRLLAEAPQPDLARSPGPPRPDS